VWGKPLSGFCTTGYFGPIFKIFCYWKNSTEAVKNNGSGQCGCQHSQCRMSAGWDSLIIFNAPTLLQPSGFSYGNDSDWLSYFVTDV